MDALEDSMAAPQRAALVRLCARRFAADDTCPLPPSGGISYVTLADGMSAAFEQELKAAGANIVGFIGPNTWVVRVGDQLQRNTLQSRLRSHNRVVGASRREAADAASPQLWRLLESGWPALAPIRVLFWRDVTPEQADALITGTTDLLVPRDEFGRPALETRYVEIAANEGQTRAILASPLTAYVELINARRVSNQTSVGVSNADTLDGGIYNLDGTGQIVGIWDGAGVFMHGDFDTRVTNVSAYVANGNGFHATHVTGTILGSGAGHAPARGFAPAATSFNYNFNGDIPAERRLRRHNSRHVVDNHSYGAGDETGPFGGYDAFAAEVDFDNRDVLMIMCKAAGNEGAVGSGTVFDDSCIKNGLVVAAVNDNGTTIASFSSRGPADDGRLVPQITSNGVGLVSTMDPISPDPQSPSGYTAYSGTSMATPSTTGAITLLSELWKREHNNMELAPDVARAVLFQTADDQGNAGPDYQFGFGVVDAKAAADLILADEANGGKQIVRGCVYQNGVIDYDVLVAPALPEFKVMLNWLDEAGTPGAGTKLVNDLDLELIDPSGGVHFPFSGLTTGGSQSTVFTQTAPNRRDNAEMAVITLPAAGDWIIRVRAFNLASASRPQGFVLATSIPITHNNAFYEDAANPPNNGTPVVIPDGVTSLTRTFNVTETDDITQVRLYASILHTTRGHLEIRLEHPDSTEVIIEDNEAVGADAARDDIFAIYPDTRAPANPMSAFDGKPANGTWTITISDVTIGTAGTLVYLALELEFDSSPAGSGRPDADAGPDQTVDETDPVTLDGSGSSDPESQPLTFQWEQISGTPTLSLSGDDTDTCTFTAPQVSSDRTFVFRLTVSDPDFGVDIDTVSVTVQNTSSSNLPPVADAGADQGVAINSNVTLDGSASTDPEANPLTYSWQQISGANPVALSDDTAAMPTFTAPGANDTLTFRLTVDDSNGSTDTDTVVITVTGGAPPPAPKSNKKEDKGGLCSAATDSSPALLAVFGLLALAIAGRRRRKAS
ncbi:MAG: S8 family serine peptidase [Planctomycetes bacterium]|nr:S8 family serine peptidase [Planctomycetota bacterium]